LNLIEL